VPGEEGGGIKDSDIKIGGGERVHTVCITYKSKEKRGGSSRSHRLPERKRRGPVLQLVCKMGGGNFEKEEKGKEIFGSFSVSGGGRKIIIFEN